MRERSCGLRVFAGTKVANSQSRSCRGSRRRRARVSATGAAVGARPVAGDRCASRTASACRACRRCPSRPTGTPRSGPRRLRAARKPRSSERKPTPAPRARARRCARGRRAGAFGGELAALDQCAAASFAPGGRARSPPQYNRRDRCSVETSWSSARDRSAPSPRSPARGWVTRVTLLEAQARIDDSPRASTTQPPTLEILAELGLIDEYIRVGLVARTFQFWDRPTRDAHRGVRFRAAARRDRFSLRGADRAAQARQHGASSGCAACRTRRSAWERRVTQIEQDEEQVTVSTSKAEHFARRLRHRLRRRPQHGAQVPRHRVRGLHLARALPGDHHAVRLRRGARLLLPQLHGRPGGVDQSLQGRGRRPARAAGARCTTRARTRATRKRSSDERGARAARQGPRPRRQARYAPPQPLQRAPARGEAASARAACSCAATRRT